MATLKLKSSRLARWMAPLAPLVGVNASSLPGVSFQRLTRSQARRPAVYEPSLKVVGQGRVRGHLGKEIFRYDAENYLVLTVPLPVECEIQASLSEPLVFMSIDLDWTVLGGLLAEMEPGAATRAPLPRAIHATPLTEELREGVFRLLRCLRSPVEARLLGPAIVREIFYRALQGEQGETLRAATLRQGGFARISRALRLLHRDYAKRPSVAALADAAGMSVPTFYRHFKAVTALSPQRYLQAVRLHKARSLLVNDRLSVAEAGTQVGYESASQFSREFRRFFSRSPKSESIQGEPA